MSEFDSAAAAVDAVVDGGAADAAPVEVAEAAPVADVMDTDTEGIKSFDQAYVSKLRAEAAKYRTQARETQDQLKGVQTKYQEFEGYDQADLDVWKQLAVQWNSSPQQAAESMRTIAVNVLGDPNATSQEKAEAVEVIEQTTPGASPENIEKIIDARIAEREKNTEFQGRVQGIENTLVSEGFVKGSAQYANVLWHATNNKDTGGDISKAIEAHRAYEQSVVDQYVSNVKEGKTQVRGPAAPGVSGSAAPDAPENIKSATSAARAFLDAQRGA